MRLGGSLALPISAGFEFFHSFRTSGDWTFVAPKNVETLTRRFASPSPQGRGRDPRMRVLPPGAAPQPMKMLHRAATVRERLRQSARFHPSLTSGLGFPLFSWEARIATEQASEELS